MSDASWPAGVRRLDLAGIAVVGEPPVAARRVARLIDGISGPIEQLARVRRAYPHLGAEQVAAVGELAELHPAALEPPRRPWQLAASLAVPLGLGTLLAMPLALGPLSLVWLAMAAQHPPEQPAAVAPAVWGILAAGIATALGPGLLLLRLAPLGRTLAVAISLGAALLVALRNPGGLGPMVPSAVLAVLLLHPACGRWCTPEGRAAAAGYSTRVYVAGLAGALLVLVLLGGVLPRFGEVFRSMNVALPLLTRWLLDLSELLEGPLPILPLVLAAAVTPLLLVPARRESTALWGSIVAGLLATALVIQAVFGPIFELQRQLSQD